jgi:hypothetical protein
VSDFRPGILPTVLSTKRVNAIVINRCFLLFRVGVALERIDFKTEKNEK